MKPTQKKTVYFVRHGQSEHNALPVFQSPEAKLSKQGIAQAQAVANRLADISFETLISSPYPRAMQTAEAIAQKTGHTITQSELFVERKKPTAIEGKPYSDKEASKLYGKYIDTIFTPGVRVEDAENYDDLVDRADKALDFLLTRPESTVTVVTHGWFLRVIIARVLLGDQLNNECLQRFEELVSIDNTGITALTYRDAFEEEHRWRVWMLNDHSHFAE